MKEKGIHEIKSIFWTSLYFFSWFGGLMVIKVLLLREYHIEFVGFSMVVVGALVVAKVVLVLEYIKMPFTKNQPAWIEIMLRTWLYLAGVFVIMVVEKVFEARNEYSGTIEALRNISRHADIHHIYVNIICVFGALFFFNVWSVVKKHFGKGVFITIMSTPVPSKAT
jgi:hypothetical protein